MALQNTFYVIGIVYMSLGIVVFLMGAIILYMVYSKVSQLHDLVAHKFAHLIEVIELAAGAGAIAKTAIKSVKKIIESDEKED